MMKYGLLDNAAENMNTEYGDLMLCVEVVSSLDAAMAHIHTYGRYVRFLQICNNLNLVVTPKAL